MDEEADALALRENTSKNTALSRHQWIFDTISYYDQIPTDRLTKDEQVAKLRLNHMHLPFASLHDYEGKVVLFNGGHGCQKSDFTTIANFLPHVYPPSVKRIDQLRPIEVRQLGLEKYHLGRYVILKLCTPGFRSPERRAVTAVVSDRDDQAVSLHFYNQNSESLSAAKDILVEGEIILVKEPYFTNDKKCGYVIHVDHITDLMYLLPGDSLIPNIWRVDGEDQRGVKDLLGEISVRVENEEWRKALICCHLALQRSQSNDLATEIKLWRVIIHNHLGNYEAAFSDLDFVGRIADQPIPQSSLMVTILEELNLYEVALKVAQLIYSRHQNSSDVKLLIARSQKMVKEHLSGVYDFAAMIKEADESVLPLLKHASYSGPVEVCDSIGKGMGIFATRDIMVGELLLCEKAIAYAHTPSRDGLMKARNMLSLCVVDLHGGRNDKWYWAAEAPLLNRAVQVLSRNPDRWKKFLALHHKGYENKVYHEEVDGVLPVDTFLIHHTLVKNCFTSQPTKTIFMRRLSGPSTYTPSQDHTISTTSSGIWMLASRFNHSCLPSSRQSFLGDFIIIRATRDIPQGEEITLAYITHQTRYPTEETFKRWDFKCECALCKDAAARRLQTVSISEFLKAGTFESVEDALQKWEREHYDYDIPGINAVIPRTELATRYIALAHTYSAAQQPKRTRLALFKAFFLLGFTLVGTILSNEELRIVEWGFVIDELAECWSMAGLCYLMEGQSIKADACVRFASLAYTIVTGEEHEGFQGAFGPSYTYYMERGELWSGFRGVQEAGVV